MGHDDVTVTIVTPERRALSLFGEEASAAVAEELRRRVSSCRTGVVARRNKDGLVLEPGGERLDAQRLYAVPRLVGPALEGLPADEEGFIIAGDERACEGCERTWAAGDARGLAAQVRRSRDASGAPRRGGDRPPGRRRGRARPWRAGRHGRLLVGRGTRLLRGRGDAEDAWQWCDPGQDLSSVPSRRVDTASRPAAEEPRARGSPSIARSATCAGPSSNTSTTSRASSAAPTRRSPARAPHARGRER